MPPDSSSWVLKLGAFIVAAACVELAVTRKLRAVQEELSVDTIIEGLTLIVRDSFELLTDVSQVSRQLVKNASAEGGRQLTHGELATIVLTDSLQEKLVKIKEDALRKVNVRSTLPHFYSCADGFLSNDNVRGLLDGYEMMVHDAVAGVLPIMPYYKPYPHPTQEEVLKVLCSIQSMQTQQMIGVFRQAVDEEGIEACSRWLSADSDHFDGARAPTHIGSRLRAAVRAVEDDVIKESHDLVGDRRNFLHLVAKCHKDPQFEKSWDVVREVAETRLLEGVQKLLSPTKASGDETRDGSLL